MQASSRPKTRKKSCTSVISVFLFLLVLSYFFYFFFPTFFFHFHRCLPCTPFFIIISFFSFISSQIVKATLFIYYVCFHSFQFHVFVNFFSNFILFFLWAEHFIQKSDYFFLLSICFHSLFLLFLPFSSSLPSLLTLFPPFLLIYRESRNSLFATTISIQHSTVAFFLP